MPHKPSIVGNLALAGYEDIFCLGTGKVDGERIVQIPLTDLHPPEMHPFSVIDDLGMAQLAKSIKAYGIREPGIARPRADGVYELLCGNRRKRACELAKVYSMPVIVRELNDADAILVMIDSNLEQRDKILPSEKAWAYKMKMEALNHKGIKGEMHSVEVLVEQTGESKNQIFRIIRLTELVNTLLDRVDAKKLAFNPAVELSYLTQIEQTAVAAAMDKYENKPSLSQAIRLKKMNQAGELTVDLIDSILAESKKPPPGEPKGSDRYRRFFPPGYSTKDIDNVITSLLKGWQAEQARKTAE